VVGTPLGKGFRDCLATAMMFDCLLQIRFIGLSLKRAIISEQGIARNRSGGVWFFWYIVVAHRMECEWEPVE